jgi:hypothetical protein
VYFYLIRWLKGDVSGHDQEVEEACWFPMTEALKQIYYPTERDMVKKAKVILEDSTAKKSLPA